VTNWHGARGVEVNDKLLELKLISRRGEDVQHGINLHGVRGITNAIQTHDVALALIGKNSSQYTESLLRSFGNDWPNITDEQIAFILKSIVGRWNSAPAYGLTFRHQTAQS
jgi:hypothetical protein